MRLKTVLIFVGIACLLFVVLKYAQNKDSHKLFSQRALLSRPVSTQPIVFVLFNTKNCTSIATTIYNTVMLAESPLRISFVVLSDETANKDFYNDLERLTRELSININVIHEYFTNTIESAMKLIYQSGERLVNGNKTYVVLDHNSQYVQQDFDRWIEEFMNSQHNTYAVFTNFQYGRFPKISYNYQTKAIELDTEVYTNLPETPVDLLMVSLHTFILTDAGLRTLLMSRPFVPEIQFNCQSIVSHLSLSDWVIQSGLQLKSLDVQFSSRRSFVNQRVLSASNVVLSKEYQQYSGITVHDDTKKTIISTRTQCGLTEYAEQTNESRCKYGSELAAREEIQKQQHHQRQSLYSSMERMF